MSSKQRKEPLIFEPLKFYCIEGISSYRVKIKDSHSQLAVGAVGVRVPLYLGHS